MGCSPLILHRRHQHDEPRTTATRENVPTDADDESELSLGLEEEVTALLGLSPELHQRALLVAVLLHVLLGTLEDDLALDLVLLHSA